MLHITYNDIYNFHLTPCFDRISCVQVKVIDCLARELLELAAIVAS